MGPMPLIRCDISKSSVQMFVDCADGTQLEIVPQTSRLMPLGSGEPAFASRSTNALVRLKRSDVSVVSKGLGEVQVFTGAGVASAADAEKLGRPTGRYVAHCDTNSLTLRDQDGDDYELCGDQTLNTVSLVAKVSEDGTLPSPRCLVTNQAHMARGADILEIPEQAPAPRLFIIHGHGGAEELLTSERAELMLETARNDPLAKVVGDQPLHESSATGDNRISHTIFQKRLPDVPIPAPPAMTALPEGLEVAGSIFSMATSASARVTSTQDPTMAITEFRQLIQYPAIEEETRTKFQGTLKQYRQWEVEQAQKLKDLLKPEGKGKKDAKKDKKKEDKAGEKKKKKKKKKK